MRGFYIMIEVMFVATLCFWVFNVVRYIYPIKEPSWLILLYYILSFMVLFFHVIYYVTRIIDPNKDPFIYNAEKGLTWDDGLEVCNISSLIALGWLVCATMYHLKTSIRIAFKQIDEKEAPKKLRCMYIYAISMTNV